MITHLFYLNSSKTLPLKEAQNRKFTAFCGLANPKSFGQSLASLGLFPGRFRAFPDHVSFGPETLQTLRQDLLDLGAEFLVTTYKDAVKLMGSDLPIIVAETSLRLTEPQRFMETLLSLLPPKGAL
jgi:tetraacyldisaccharide 4'-kinase